MSKPSTSRETGASGLWAERMAHANAIEGNPLTPAEQALIDKLIADGTDAKTAVEMIVSAAHAAKDKASRQQQDQTQPITVAE